MWFEIPLGQEISEERIEHSTARIHGSHPITVLFPSRPIRRFNLLSGHERTLIQQRNTISLGREVVELLQKSVPGGFIRIGMNRINGKNITRLRVG